MLYIHIHIWHYNSYVSLASLRTFGMTAEVFELSHKKISFTTGYGHGKYFGFSMLIIWMSGIGCTMERKH